MLLISGLITYGLGNWLDTASHVGSRTKEECEKHYCEVYLGVEPDGKPADAEEYRDESPAPVQDGDKPASEAEGSSKRRREFMPVSWNILPWSQLGQAQLTEQPMELTFDVDPDEFQRRKKHRIEEMRKPKGGFPDHSYWNMRIC